MAVPAGRPHGRLTVSSRNLEPDTLPLGMGGMTARLLVVDDEPRTAEVTADLLRRAGYAVDVAASGTEALERVRTASPDLMLLDYEMPDMEAPEVLDSLRSGSDRISF